MLFLLHLHPHLWPLRGLYFDLPEKSLQISGLELTLELKANIWQISHFHPL